MKIGDITLKGKLILAPMAGVTDVAFRLLCKQYGAALVYTQFVNINALANNNQATLNLAKTVEEERPVAIQLFGSRLDNLSKAVKVIKDQADIIDFNFGCPSPVVVNQGAGAALLRRPQRMKEIIQIIIKESGKPVTAKIRSGFSKREINAIQIAKQLEEAGVSAITLHARTLDQGYSGKADWDLISQVKESVSIPVIGNGDVKTGPDAKKMLDITGCDGVMIGRAAMSNPHLFKEVNHYLRTKKQMDSPSAKDKIKLYKEYIVLAKKYKVDSIVKLRQFAQEFTKGLNGGAKTRAQLNNVNSSEEIIELLEKLT
ncbi:MAG: tRNA dihydrouridine synthase DusB [archaeon]